MISSEAKTTKVIDILEKQQQMAMRFFAKSLYMLSICFFVLVIAAEPKKATVTAEPVVLDTAEATAKVVRQLLQAKAPVALDFEGVDLCRNGELALVLLSDGTTTWLVDITTMGQAAFEDDGGRLRLLLESKDVLKVGYDGRGDADALHHLHKTGLTPYYDVQIASCMRQDADQGRRDPFVHGLGKAMASFLRGDFERAGELQSIKQEGLAVVGAAARARSRRRA